MKLKVLMENTAAQENIASEHGLSLYIETGDHRILFDMGQTDAFIRNAEQMGVDLRSVDLAFLSHGHNDHGGGMQAFLALNDHAPVYVHELAFGCHGHGDEVYIGLDGALRDNGRLIFASGDTVVDEHLSLHDCNACECHHPIEAYRLIIRTENGWQPETFRHEQYLLIREGGRKILISGCSHKGVVNVARWLAPDVLIGGFHLVRVEDERKIESIADELLSLPIEYYTGHCTGLVQYDQLKKRMGGRLHYLSAGSEWII